MLYNALNHLLPLLKNGIFERLKKLLRSTRTFYRAISISCLPPVTSFPSSRYFPIFLLCSSPSSWTNIFFLPDKPFSTTTPLKCHDQWSLLNFIASNWKALNTKSESRFSDLQGKVVDCNCFVEENLLLTFSLWLSLIFPICQFYVWCTTFCILLSVWEPSASRLSLFKRGEPQFALVHCVDQSNNHQ